MDVDLFDALRDVRLRLARERGVPPYVIFHDTTLRDMVARRPSTIDELHEVYGVGMKKAADFGDAFLDAIRTFRRPQGWDWGFGIWDCDYRLRLATTTIEANRHRLRSATRATALSGDSPGSAIADRMETVVRSASPHHATSVASHEAREPFGELVEHHRIAVAEQAQEAMLLPAAQEAVGRNRLGHRARGGRDEAEPRRRVRRGRAPDRVRPSRP